VRGTTPGRLPSRLSIISIIIIILLLLAAGCGSDDGAGVRQVDGTQASASATGSGSATGSPSASQVACKPVGTPSADASKVEVELTEWAVRPATTAINPGQVTFQARNTGADPHELVIVRGDNPTSLPLAADQTVDEGKLPKGAFIGEIEAFPAKQTCTGTFTLSPGRYVLFCNILEQEAGVEENHFQKGMRTTVTVA
jgi:plastocyanin